jgi:hypothetical protein
MMPVDRRDVCDPAAMDLELDAPEPAADVLAAVARGDRAPVLRLLVPAPAVSFGRLDALLDG